MPGRATSDPTSTFRVTTYNILDGGIGRADPIAEVLLAQRPDVVCLVEADDAEVRDRIAWRLGFDQIAATGRQGRTSCLMTRGTILSSANLANKKSPRSLLACEVELDGFELGVAVAHFTGRASEERETEREREAASLLEAATAWRQKGVPHVLAGDFNSTAPDQKIDASRLPPKVLPHYEANGRSIPRRVIAKLLDAGYADALAVRNSDANTTATFTTRCPGMRLDYILTRGFDVVAAAVEHDRLAKAASDHFPVTAELRRFA